MYAKQFASLIVVTTCLFSAAPRLAAQTAPSKYPIVAEVSGDNVYVRSGASQNFYPVTKLKAGAKVTIVGEQGEWVEILPPEGVYSLVSGDYVDTADDKSGVINGDNVQVRATSTIPEFAKDRYKVQTKLSKGATVAIIERQPDGYLRIVPPQGATLWMSRGFVDLNAGDPLGIDKPKVDAKKTGDAAVAAHEPAESDPLIKAPVATSHTKEKVKAAAGHQEPATTLAAFPTVEWTPTLEKLRELDVQAEAELKKPPLERRLDALRAEYKAIADRSEGDEPTLAYARGRVAEIAEIESVIEGVRRMRRLTDEADSKRREHLAERAVMRDVRRPMPTGLDAKGELMPSAVFTRTSGPRRYRLVDPLSTGGRTIGYVEIPEKSTIDVDAFMGQYVGVRATETRFLPGGVKPVPVFVAGELIVLQREDDRMAVQPDSSAKSTP